MARAPVKITKNLDLPVAAGQYHRLICMTGKNKGHCYYLGDGRVVMGRSNKTDIQILDTQASREHVELTRVGDKYILTDLQSQNGVFVNDLKVNQHKLKNGDKVIVGSTVYKYSYLEVMPEVVELEEEEEEDEEEEEVKPKKKSKKQEGANKRLLIIAVVGIGLWIMLDSDEKPKKASSPQSQISKRNDISRDSENLSMNSDLDPEMQSKLMAYIHRGRREAREGNYIRALEEFTLARTLDPGNGSVAFYINRASQRLIEYINEVNEQAERFRNSKMYTSAHGKYCTVVKMLEKYSSNKDLSGKYKEAQDNAKEMSLRIGLKEDETNCK